MVAREAHNGRTSTAEPYSNRNVIPVPKEQDKASPLEDKLACVANAKGSAPDWSQKG